MVRNSQKTGIVLITVVGFFLNFICGYQWRICLNNVPKDELQSVPLPVNRFLKSPLFMTSLVFLKKDTQIAALEMVMCLCLLVYTLTQRYLLQKLMELFTSVSNQLVKPTKRPTKR
jgi:transposase